jgi:hypothetical protein
VLLGRVASNAHALIVATVNFSVKQTHGADRR